MLESSGNGLEILIFAIIFLVICAYFFSKIWNPPHLKEDEKN
jgi:hypothetical protein